ncbi:MAG: DUF4058 family protein [Chloroflexi bacterium]|nr:DUF4058 family protein [Chloroflexota bacterium]
MPSPFPGMDPYIEDPALWQDFHNNLASEIQGQLNSHIQPRYFAALTPYVTYDILEIAEVRGVRPDVGIWESASVTLAEPQGVAVIDRAPAESMVRLEVPYRQYSVEIRSAAENQLVTAIEILSPVNKRTGHEAYEAYRNKRRDLLRSGTHLMEIDLLRGGERPPLERPVPAAPYYVILSRVERRPKVEVWPISVEARLPVLPVPLREPDPDAALDLGAAVTAVYMRGAYAVRIDYRKPPPPPALSPEQIVWVDARLQESRESR